jgi:hypothetical protein
MRDLFLLIATTCFAFTACERTASVNEPKLYSKDSLEFNYPANWRITEDKQTGDIRLLFIETPGEALTTIAIYPLDDAPEIREFARTHAATMRNETAKLRVSESIFGEPESSGGYNSLHEQFSIGALGQELPHVRIYKQKQFGKKVVYIVFQVADEDKDLVEAGFDQIVASVRYEGKRDE